MGGLAEPIDNAVLAVPPVDESGMAAPRNPGKESFVRRWARRLIVFVCVLALLPILLTILYLPPFVHPVSTLMLGDLVTLKGYDRQWVAYDDIADVMKRSVVMSEDGQFCSHRGVDLGELRGVVDDALQGEATRGASTIPMQTVKNLFLTNSRSFVRKAAEIPLALYFDLVMPKKRILEIYLNIAEWGPNIYGVEAAAQHHFGVSAKNLTARQAALLTVSLPNPILRKAGKPSRLLTRMGRRIEQRAAKSGAYTACL